MTVLVCRWSPTMSICQFCKEEVHQEAIKCRHCGSFLGGDVKKPVRAHVTYVVDQDIVRFAKFALPILLIFLIAGAFLYGFDIRIAAKEIREIREEIRKDADAIRLLKEGLTTLHKESMDLVTKTAGSLTEANKKVNQIEGQMSSLGTEIEFLNARLSTAQDVLSTVVDRTNNATFRPATESDDRAVLAEFFSQHRDSVLVIAETRNSDTVSIASGLVVSAKGHILTADYVVVDLGRFREISAVAADGTVLNVEVVVVDEEDGLALLKTEPYESMAVLQLADDVPTERTPVIAIGSDKQRTLRSVEGVVTDINSEWLLVEFDEDVIGFGGGPVLTLDGRVVGIVHSSFPASGPTIDSCKRSDVIKSFLVSHGVPIE